MAAISRSSRSHLPNLFFEPYLINIRCSLSLKYVIQLEVPYLKSHFLGTVHNLSKEKVSCKGVFKRGGGVQGVQTPPPPKKKFLIFF